ncbi:MAG: hypothetical protein KF746_15885 [Chitinophagaceae bacterium]|nr:hypothetical protein [Chitinophagaceae bacterium]
MKKMVFFFVKSSTLLLLTLVAFVFLNVIIHTFLKGWGIDYDFFQGLYHLFDSVIYQIDRIFFKTGYKTKSLTGVPSDSPFSALLLISTVFLVFFVSVVWTFVQRKNTAASLVKLERYNEKLREIVRIAVAVIMYYYGIRKVFLLQMPSYRMDQLLTQFGFFSRSELMWTFIGASKSFQFFLGVSEVFVSFLLFFRRTSLLGLLIAFAITTNICVMNFAYDVPARMLAGLLMLMVVYLLLPYIKVLYAFFVQDRPTKIDFHKWKYTGERYGKIFNRILLFVIPLLIITDMFLVLSRNRRRSDPPIAIYQAETFVSKGDTIPLLANREGRWNFMVFRTNEVLTVIYSQGNRKDFRYKMDSVENKLSLFKYTYFKDSIPVSVYEVDRLENKNLALRSSKDSLYSSMQFIPDSVFNFDIEGKKKWADKLPASSVK